MAGVLASEMVQFLGVEIALNLIEIKYLSERKIFASEQVEKGCETPLYEWIGLIDS